ncbi:MAG: hypothetical protein K8S98_11805 [Planctomycetes bacterium]|nr:hypothetical protein [Planctomycetota bacterium]
MPTELVALALDLGTTRIKAGAIDADGKLSHVHAIDSPPTLGTGRERLSDPDAWRRAALGLVAELDRELDATLPIGLSSQRSSFLFVDARHQRPRSPLISWQDRSAEAWCTAHRAFEPRMRALSGLVLSPHYVGPKIAARVESDRALAEALGSGEVQVRTLDAWIVAALERDLATRTDLSCAARTGLVDLETRGYSDELLGAFGVPRVALAPLAPSVDLGAPRVRAQLADQASAALAVLGEEAGGALVNLGTGGFVLVATGARAVRADGYLTAPILARERSAAFVLEGTINAGGATAERFASGPTAWPDVDPTPDEFCVPDENGWGAPFWRADGTLRFSGGTHVGCHADLRRVVLEGLCFRVASILADLGRATKVERVALAGGLAHDPFVARALAAVLVRPIEVVGEFEASLSGVGRLAAGLDPRERARPTSVEPRDGDAWLREKYERWRAWVATLGPT